ncbi:hypothetical protein GCM10011487_47540 [Steroidobacter agaridevorans]|uniref:DUF763 domain-containing protein n=2 Tax=Steroidobacter agaridevorans TaxID=2695856 RepID=A0A829YHK9_9GAMM|nr:hypothetical protein GCM10011487_47540 [Steroidobacter agaridevorans]GFE85841.1 hypothetical protein GCM10011488_07950 [Steroidobacter agaridevorans]
MAKLGRVIVEAVVLEYGRDELLRRLAHPFWFQSFGAVMGMDWHSSGITTSVIGALKRGLTPVQQELGIYVCGGKGAKSRDTPQELTAVGDRTGLDATPLTNASRLVAKVDSAAVQDGYDLYLHAFIVSTEGRWCVVQQGMNEQRREARRYHWLSENLQSFLDSPHSAIEGRNQGSIINLADARAERNRRAGLELVHAGPDRPVTLLKRWRDSGNTALSLFPELEPAPEPHLRLPAHHEVRASDVVLRRLHAALAAAADRGPKDFADLLLTPGVGARTVAALAFVAEVLHGAPSRFTDPARFSMAHGGKDGHPFPVPLKVYDQTIRVLKDAVGRAKLGNDERLAAIRQLDAQARALEGQVCGPSFDEFISEERANAAEYGGRTVFDPK